jgi:hypothetical protein
MGRCAVGWTERRLLRLMRSAARRIIGPVQGTGDARRGTIKVEMPDK